MRNLVGAVVLAGICLAANAQITLSNPALDSDHDGLTDTQESLLLRQFLPRFIISSTDCSGKPARFSPAFATPTVTDDDGTIYGQAFLHGHSSGEIELHFYHLWRRDCGEMGHALDTEHVSVLLHRDGKLSGSWKALYWYAAAHEDTLCDASQITRASTVHAEIQGALIWVSAGKHASFLDEKLCRHGCGGDRCLSEKVLKSPGVVNLGETDYPMSGATWTRSTHWPLAIKMSRTDFTAARLRRMDGLPETDIAWANPARRPAQAVILGGNSTINGVAIGGAGTNTALVLADDKTGNALGDAAQNTGHALAHSSANVWKALGSATRHTKEALSPGKDNPGSTDHRH